MKLWNNHVVFKAKPFTEPCINTILILKGIDNYQWKNLYLFIYSRWEKTREVIDKKHNIEMSSLPIYNKQIDIKETIYNFINQDISLELFFLNSFQIYFLPNPN